VAKFTVPLQYAAAAAAASLENIERILKLAVFVKAGREFLQHPQVTE